jgi:hypothetical protein
MRVGIRRAHRDSDHADACVLGTTPHVPTPFLIAIADQDLRRLYGRGVIHRQRSNDLLHKQRLGMRRGAEDLDLTELVLRPGLRRFLQGLADSIR